MINLINSYESILKYVLYFLIIIGFSFEFCSCSGCSQSGIRNAKNNRVISTNIKSTNEQDDQLINERRNQVSNHERTIIKMYKENGVYKIPVEINGAEMFFIFDTGAGLISISATEAGYLYKQGKLKDDDFIGSANFIDANGDVSEGTIIMLRTVKIGNRSLSNIEAAVVHNMVAPLLFGQSALEKFGKISIDYSRNEIVFEYTDVSGSSINNSDKQAGYMSIKKFVDGDTFWVDDGSEKGIKVRLIGVDTPESRNSGRKEVGCFGKEASEFIYNLLQNQKVRLEYDINRIDRYGRTLSYVYLMDGTFVNAELVKQGYAKVMTVPPNVKYADLFVKLQREARENNRGLWNENQ